MECLHKSHRWTPPVNISGEVKQIESRWSDFLADRSEAPIRRNSYAIDPIRGTELELDVDLAFSDHELRFALANEDDATPTQLKAMDELMAIAQGRSFEREQARVVRQAY